MGEGLRTSRPRRLACAPARPIRRTIATLPTVAGAPRPSWLQLIKKNDLPMSVAVDYVDSADWINRS